VRRGAAGAVASLVLGAALAACGSSGGSAGASGGSGGDYVIGYVNGMSGPLAVYGEYSLSYVQAAVKQANDTGGINGRQVEIKVLDSYAPGQTAVSAMQQMITQYHPVVVYGNTLDTDCQATGPVAARYKTPLICATATPQQVAPVQPYLFASQGIEAYMYKPAVDFAQQTLKLPAGTTFATMAGSGGGGGPDMDNIASLAKSLGWTDVSSQVVDTTAASIATPVSKLVAAKPQVVFAEMIGTQLTQLDQGLRAAGLNAPLIAPLVSLGYTGLVALGDPEFYDIAQTNFVTDQTAAASPGVAQVQKILTDGGMIGPTVQNQALGAQALLPGLGMLDALKVCGLSCTPQKMVTSLQTVSLSLPGFISSYQWSATSHAPVGSVTVVSYDPATKTIKTDAAGLAMAPVGSAAP
jgi:ABC-type branched-subunit amino acid transport system substrate-binding protein